ncbi:hypothetical protein [uncultured Campylobacter sp.]|uniref:hypothetical protein n=1 Tax=uncultured Campylobacter sp. TaxID=218934 RepID=UPI002629B18E|nr:hypothetical protein [uncultured Campylobacter sp.]
MAEEKEIYYDDEIEHVVTVSGKYIDKIKLETEPKRSNYIKIKEELTQKVSALYGSPISPSKSGGNHIEFKDENKDDLYVIKWDYQHIVKHVCKGLGITQRELADIIKVNSGTPAQWVTRGEVPPTYQYLLKLMIENKHLKEKIAKLTAFKELLDEI